MTFYAIHTMEDKENLYKIEWLRSLQQEVHTDCPQPRIKLSDIHKQLEKYSNYHVAEIIRKTFPNTKSKLTGKAPGRSYAKY